MSTTSRRVAFVGLGLVVAVLFAAWTTFWADPLPDPAPYIGNWPAVSPPAALAVFALPTGVTHRSAGFGYRGGSLTEARDFSMNALLVRHPAGDLLIDTGLGPDIADQLSAMKWWFVATTSYTRGVSAAEQLARGGYDQANLKAIMLTHAHWDHASGASAFPHTPVWVPVAERDFISSGNWLSAVARGATASRVVAYDFEGGPYLGFPSHHDVFGDGSVVTVPAPGHTPGSVVVFLSLANGRKLALVGDLVWQREGIELREERPLIQREMVDLDAASVRENILRMVALQKRFPELEIVPAHDQRSFSAISALPKAW